MGTTLSYIMLATLPEYNEKLNTVYSLAPVAFWKHDLKKATKGLDFGSKFIKVIYNFITLI